MTHTLDEGSSTPLYAQLRELLKSQIEDGSFAPANASHPRTSSTACTV